MTDKIGVLFLQAKTDFGADAAVHAQLMRHLNRDEFTVHAACSGGEGGGESQSLRILEQIPDVRVRQTEFIPGFSQRSAGELLRNARAFAAFPVDFWALCRYVTRERIRIVHSAERPREILYNNALARLTGAKSVVHVHVKWSDAYGRVARWGVQNADAVIAISRYVQGTVAASGRAPETIYTALNAIDVSAWDVATDGSSVRREFAIGSDAPLIVSIARLFSWKGQKELLQAFALVQKSVPNAKLLIVGADAQHLRGESFRQELEQLARETGIASDVVFTGHRSDVAQLLAACDLFALPSFEEPFGLVFLEAMVMRRPVVAVDNGGTPEVVEHERTGLLSPAWDVPRLAANIVRLLENGELRARFGENGRARVLEHFTAERMARDVADAYRRILRG